MVYTKDLKSFASRLAGSSPAPSTKNNEKSLKNFLNIFFTRDGTRTESSAKPNFCEKFETTKRGRETRSEATMFCDRVPS